MSRFTVTTHQRSHKNRTLAYHEVTDTAFRKVLVEGGLVIEGRRVASFTREDEALEYIAWRERVAALPQPGDTA